MDTKAYVYILECKDNTYYTGYTTNVKCELSNRIEKINSEKLS